MKVLSHITLTIISTPMKKKLSSRAIRQEIEKVLLTKGVELYRPEQAEKIMKPSDGETATLPKVSVLRVMRTEEVNSSHLHEDPQKALGIMKFST